MIAWLQGILADKAADRVVVNVNGVGYEVSIPFSTYYELGDVGAAVSLRIYTHVREDALSLFGFLTEKEKRLFTMLIQVAGVGPRLAVATLSGLPADELVKAVCHGDIVRLSSIPGIGKKTAERIVLELRDKLGTAFPEAQTAGGAVPTGGVQGDVVSALVNLGFARNVAEKAVSRVTKEQTVDRFEELLRKSLRQISG
jgi:Holliday junction DNA helicase RuvA